MTRTNPCVYNTCRGLVFVVCKTTGHELIFLLVCFAFLLGRRESAGEESWTKKRPFWALVCARGKPSRKYPSLSAVSVFGRKSGRIHPFCRPPRRNLSCSREKAYNILRSYVRQCTAREAGSYLVVQRRRGVCLAPGCRPWVMSEAKPIATSCARASRGRPHFVQEARTSDLYSKRWLLSIRGARVWHALAVAVRH